MRKIALFFLPLVCFTAFSQTNKFDFGSGETAKGHTKVDAGSFYTAKAGFGWMKGSAPVAGRGFISSGKPLFFTVDIPEGNYDITLLFGEDSETTLKVENRRLMLEKVLAPKGKTVSRNITVSVRSPLISGKDSVRLKPREMTYLQWDRQLTFEFTGPKPKIARIEIKPKTQVKTIFLAGNSTVVDQALEPYSSWGQMIPRFFAPGKVVIANYAESGESIQSFVTERRLAKIESQIRKGDYLFIEFAHNDQKIKDFDAFGKYADYLRKYIDGIREKGGIPVLVTSMPRRNFDQNGKIINTLGDFPEAMRGVAREKNTLLIDLNEMAGVLWESLGEETSKLAFVHYPANVFPGQTKPIEDNTHFSNYGAYELAKCMVEGIKKNIPELTALLLKDLKTFDPQHPDDPKTFDFPLSPVAEVIKPDGN
ncbi:rhamnogalacturonan acetylesterase [Emticicia sp. CRIBPO]|uniref:rhamnogalacturonan acetylesterase n=1 Tax=Emticicia sp. CRIBPO TaxID=2683258 RepID=UPI00141319AE|nr:rhamnogalacturonan acetylesterase [Emticicia sp. CRIBPO]NBA86264.1 rhamnogalacturonan acetylesterase [Emticicia sp. CRIBPO]